MFAPNAIPSTTESSPSLTPELRTRAARALGCPESHVVVTRCADYVVVQSYDGVGTDVAGYGRTLENAVRDLELSIGGAR